MCDLDSLIPLSVFQLDHPEPPEGWSKLLGPAGHCDDRRRCRSKQHFPPRRSAADAGATREPNQAGQVGPTAGAASGRRRRIRRAQIWEGLDAAQPPVGAHPATAMWRPPKPPGLVVGRCLRNRCPARHSPTTATGSRRVMSDGCSCAARM
jgi:hypothetical protein